MSRMNVEYQTIHCMRAVTFSKTRSHIQTRSEIGYFIDYIPYRYLRFFVKTVNCIAGKLSICNRFWTEAKRVYVVGKN